MQLPRGLSLGQLSLFAELSPLVALSGWQSVPVGQLRAVYDAKPDSDAPQPCLECGVRRHAHPRATQRQRSERDQAGEGANGPERLELSLRSKLSRLERLPSSRRDLPAQLVVAGGTVCQVGEAAQFPGDLPSQLVALEPQPLQVGEVPSPGISGCSWRACRSRGCPRGSRSAGCR